MIKYSILPIVFFYFFFKMIKPLSILMFNVNNPTPSKSAVISKNYTTQAYKELEIIIERKIKARWDRKSEQGQKTAKKYKKWEIDREIDAKRNLRKLKELKRAPVLLFFDTLSFNLETIHFIIKVMLYFFFFLIFFFYFIIKVSVFVFLNKFLVAIILIYTAFLIHLFNSKLILRTYRAWWWRPWPFFFHIHNYGFLEINFFYFFILFFFNLSIIWIVLPVFLQYLHIWLDQTLFSYWFVKEYNEKKKLAAILLTPPFVRNILNVFFFCIGCVVFTLEKIVVKTVKYIKSKIPISFIYYLRTWRLY